MESTSLLIWGVLFGAVGLGFFTYGRRQQAVVPLVSGLGLFLLPYFAPNLYLLLLIGGALIALPYFVRI